MTPDKLIMIGLFTAALVITVYGWMDRLRGTNSAISEAFDDMITTEDVARLAKANETDPTDLDAVKAHQTLLRYIRNDFSKGVKFVMDFGKRFYGNNLKLRDDLDVRTLMEKYQSPLQTL